MEYTLLDGVPEVYRYALWEETRRALAEWPDDPSVDVAWVSGYGITLQMSRDEAERIAALPFDRHDLIRELGARSEE